MSLYQVYESAILPYLEHNTGKVYSGYTYNEELLDGDYQETMGQMETLWTATSDIHETPSSHSVVYFLYILKTIVWPSWKIKVAAFDGQTGDLLWIDDETYPLNVVATSFYTNFWQDTDGRLWANQSWSVGYSRRFSIRTESENAYAGAAGMPTIIESDLAIQHPDWLDPNGDPYDPLYTRALAVLPKENRALILRGSGAGQQLYIHDYTTKKEIYKMALTAAAKDAAVVDDSIVYVTTANGLINVINYQLGSHLGVVSMGETVRNAYHTIITYDQIYRRILYMRGVPDDPTTGASNHLIEGWATRPIPEHLVKPIPLQTPRDGRDVRIYSRVVNASGGGVSGVPVDAVHTGTNDLNPARAYSDATGKVSYFLDCDNSGVDADDIDLTATFDEGAEGLGGGYADPTAGDPPDNISNENYFKPGWWLYSPLSGSAPATKWDAYLDVPEDERIIVGVVQEYKWTDFEQSNPSQYDWTKIEADRAYLAAKGYYLMANLVLKSDSDTDIWIPDDILNDITEPPVFPQAQDALSLITGRGIFHLTNDSATGEGWMPIFWDANVYARIRGVLGGMITQYASDFTLVGFGLGDSTYNFLDVHYADVPMTKTFYEHRIEMLEYFAGITSKLIWEFMPPATWPHGVNCAAAGINVASTRFDLDDRPDMIGPSNTTDSVAYGFTVAQGDWSSDANKLCTAGTPQATAYQMAFGDQDTVNCSMYPMEYIRPYFVFWYPDATAWSATDGIEDVCTDHLLHNVKRYYGL